MKKIIPPTKGKISLHGHGLGAVTLAMVDERAVEIALTEGRYYIDDRDRKRAWKELSGTSLPPAANDDADAGQPWSRDPSDPPSNRGYEAPIFEASDGQKAVERLVEEGVEEAQHDQMVNAHRKKHAL